MALDNNLLGKLITRALQPWQSCAERRKVDRNPFVLRRHSLLVISLVDPFFCRLNERGRGYTRCFSLSFCRYSRESLHAFETQRSRSPQWDALSWRRPPHRSHMAFFSVGSLWNSSFSTYTFSSQTPFWETQSPAQPPCLLRSISYHLIIFQNTDRLWVNLSRMSFWGVLTEGKGLAVCIDVLQDMIVLMSFQPSLFPIERQRRVGWQRQKEWWLCFERLLWWAIFVGAHK